MENDNKNKSNTCHEPICLLEKHLTRVNRVKQIKKLMVVGNRDGSNQRGALRRAGKETQVQDRREIWREKGRLIQSCRRSRENMGRQRKLDA